MNREENLLKVMPSWLDSQASEIVLVDWSCSIPLYQTLINEGIEDERIIIYRVEEEDRWILTHAYNVGLKRASNDIILKLDNDHSITDSFLSKNALVGLDARLGSWRLAKGEDQAYINGAFIIRSEALAKVGYFNEIITTYGWDDSYLHESLFANGARIGHLCPETIRHIDQAEESRTRYQKISREGSLAASTGVKPTEFMNRRNMYLSALMPRQTQSTRQTAYKIVDGSGKHHQVLKRLTSPHEEIPQSYLEHADRLAFRDFYCWKHGMLVESTCIHALEDEFSRSESAIVKSEYPKIESEIRLVNPYPQKRPDNTESYCDKQDLVSIWKFIPFMLSAYGHTDNAYSYQLIANLSQAQLGLLNSSLPDWCQDKVIAVNPDNIDPERLVIDTSNYAISKLIGMLVLGTKEDNSYFWAAFNSLAPANKKCLFDFIEAAGRPYRLLTDYFLDASPSSTLRREITPERFIRSIAAIYPNRPSHSFESYLNDFKQRLIRDEEAEEALPSESMDDLDHDTDSYSMTLVTSLFKGLRYVVGYAMNLRRMHLFNRTEILIYIAPSPEADAAYKYLTHYFRQDKNVNVRILDGDPGLYECWNLGIRNARGKYVSNANADDRRGRYHSDYLVFVSELHQLSAVSSALLTDRKLTHSGYSDTQDIWFTGMGCDIQKDNLYIEIDGMIESQNLLHCMPIWARSLHERIGFFDEHQFGTSADWEFWLRAVSSKYKLQLIDIPLGFYLVDDKSHNRRNQEERQNKERKIMSLHLPDLKRSLTLRLT